MLAGRRPAALLFGGAGILLYRTVALLAGSGRVVLKPWVVALTFIEMALDCVTMAGSARWWLTRCAGHARLPLRAGVAATLLHAARVSVFVLGRTGPWRDFDVRPEHRADHDERWTWSQVVLASVLSVLGVIGVVVVWWFRRRSPAGARHPR
ncbi:MAG: hypothetical protein OEV40_24980 [Acidimicrobiia bacterium]|nr:hypothetical protein [Acidimicrobiia bacterium]